MAVCSSSCPPARTHRSPGRSCRPTAFRSRSARRSTRWCRTCDWARLPSSFPKRRCRPRTTRHLREILAEQPPWSDLPVLLLTRRGADSAALDEAVRYARQRHAAGAPGPCRDAAECRPDRHSGTRAPVPNPRAPRGSGARGRIPSARRSAQGRIPRDAWSRAAQPACSTVDRPAADQTGWRPGSGRRQGDGGHGTPDQPPRSTGGRSARSLADYAEA